MVVVKLCGDSFSERSKCIKYYQIFNYYNIKYYVMVKAVTRWSVFAIWVDLGRSRVLSGPLL